jgi:uncharacterized protein
MTIVHADAIPPTPWKNGGGRTRELFVWPAEGHWQLRISLADIEQDGPFSAYLGVQRHFAVLEGAGVCLHFAGGEHLLRRGDAPLAFDGAAAPDCVLIDGPTRDLNLMLRGVPGGMSLALEGSTAPQAPWNALFSAGAARLGGIDLPPRSLLLDLPAATPLRKLDAAPAFWLTAKLSR